MTASLGVHDFPDYFRCLHGEDDKPGPDPFPWQSRLVDQVAQTGSWPTLLDLPTGAGKTAAIDAAVFLLALRGDQPRRMVFVVDRRIVVHQAAERTAHIASRLERARGGLLRTVADRLRSLAGSDEGQPPLEYAELRGGIVRDDDWSRRPDVPTVIVSTVDQVGSRLLFRGYGVSRGMRPVHAGLLGNDVLYLLDEVHLARPFAETLEAIHTRYRPPPETGLPDRWAVVELSATPTRAGDALRLEAEDRDPAVAPVLARRLAASKPASAELVKVTGTDGSRHRAALAEAAAARAQTMLGAPGVRTVGVVVNRVDTATRVYQLLAGRRIKTVLLTGRMRSLDRDVLLEEYRDRLRTGRERRDGDTPLVLVATQAIEAGADLDLDGLVTECAPLDALVQRFGRVDRAGDLTASGRPARSVILATSADVAAEAEDPVYGDRLRLTWAWLQDRTLNFGIDALDLDAATRMTLSSPAPEAPFLMPSHLDRWVQTSVDPDADPDPAHWLHGLRRDGVDVTVVWRADVQENAFHGANGSKEEAEAARHRVTAVVSLCPPGSGEAMQVPLAAVRGWLTSRLDPGGSDPGGSVTSFADVAIGQTEAQDPAQERPGDLRPALLWSGDDSTVITTASGLTPSSTIVVPATYGGITGHNWDPGSTATVTDLGTAVQATQRGRAVLRLHPAMAQQFGTPIPSIPLPPPDNDDIGLDRELVVEWLDGLELPQSPANRWLPTVIGALRTQWSGADVLRVQLTPPAAPGEEPPEMFVVRSRRRVPALTSRRRGSSADSEPATSSFLGSEVTLPRHLADVEGWARRLAIGCDLPAGIVSDLALAAGLHDLGKVDSRFQTMLRDGDVAVDGQPLAKSLLQSTDPWQRRRAQRAAGYPNGTRHELATLALVQHDDVLRARAADWDLVLHLIASHHGYARPFVPVADEPSPQELRVIWGGMELTASSDHGLYRLDSGVPQRFWRCVRRYGWYGLAWLEAILRLADHRASEQRATGGGVQ